VWNEMQAALRGGAPFRLTYRILTATREEKWVWNRAGPSLLVKEICRRWKDLSPI